jgi:hypothetical protein
MCRKDTEFKLFSMCNVKFAERWYGIRLESKSVS